MKRFALLAIALLGLLPLVARAQSSSSPLNSFAALKAVALNQTDLIGYTLESEHDAGSNAPSAVVAAYFGTWATVTPTPALVSNALITTTSTAVARDSFSATVSGVLNDPNDLQPQDLGRQGVGDQDDEISFQLAVGNSGLTVQAYAETMQIGPVITSVIVAGLPGSVTAQNAVAYARIIAGRIVAAQGPSAAQPSPSASPSSAPQAQPAPSSPTAPIAPAFQPQGLVTMASQYVTSGGYVYAGDCSQVTSNDAGAICTLMYGPDSNGNYTISYSIVGADGTPEPPFGSQTVSPDQAPAPSATPATSPAAPASTPSPVPVEGRAR